MPDYTNAWDPTFAAGTLPARQIDDLIRRLALDIEERMADLVVDWRADPVVLKSTPGSGSNIVKVIGAAAFSSGSRAGVPYYFDSNGTLIGTPDTPPLVAPIDIPAGSVIKSMELLGNIGWATGLTLSLMRRPFATGSPTTVQTISRTAAGLGVTASTPFTETTSTSTIHFLMLEATGGTGNGVTFEFHGARVTYDYGVSA